MGGALGRRLDVDEQPTALCSPRLPQLIERPCMRRQRSISRGRRQYQGGGGRSLTVEADLGRTTVDVREGLGSARVVPGVLAPRLYRVRLRIPKGLKAVCDRRSGRGRHALCWVHERVLVLAHRRAVQQRVRGLIGRHTGKHTGAAACRCCASAHQAVHGCLHIPVVRLEKRDGKPVVVRARDRLEHG